MIYLFDDYELDTQLFELRVQGKPCHLEPQVFNLLTYLVRHRDRVVTKDELLEEVWGTQFITEATLSSRLMAARKAIGDDGQTQRFIKTLRGRGFRFMHEVTERAPQTSAASESENSSATPDTRVLEAQRFPLQPAPAAQVVPVGRETEFRHLHRHFEKAQNGTRQVVFVTGEAGVGKTTLVSSFVESLQNSENVRIACGQCLEQRGASEAYMPLLDAFARLCRSSDGAAVIDVLRKCAPTWLVQMPWLLSVQDLEALQTAARGATRERMLREMVQTLESITETQPLVLILEDLHWSDFPTLDLLSWLARRTETARLLILGTYRPADITLDHPLRTTVQELRIRGHGVELAMPFLDERAVHEYLASRFAGASLPNEVAQILRERTGGNPLFMRNVVDEWLAHDLLTETGNGWKLQADFDELGRHVPANLRQLIEHQLSQLDQDQQQMLDAASVAGIEFATATISEDTNATEKTEEQCLELARRGQFIEERDAIEWPDGTLSTQFAFTHHLYQEVIYDRIPPSRRQRLHVQLASRLELAYGSGVRQIAPRLADHLVRGRDTRAVDYLQLAAEQALSRSAYRDAARHYSQALEILLKRPENKERKHQEMVLQRALASALIATEGWGWPGATEAFERTCALAQELSETEHLATANYGLASLLEFRGEFVAAQKLMEQRLEMLRGLEGKLENPEPFAETHDLLACSFFHQGKFDDAVQQADAGLQHYDPQRHNEEVASVGENLGVACHCWAGLSLWYLGDTSHALKRIEEALALAQSPSRAYCLASALTQSATVHQLRGETDKVREQAQATIEIATEKGFPYRIGTGSVLHGWAVAVAEKDKDGIRQLQDGIEMCHQTGVILDDPYYLALLAEAHAACGQIENAMSTLDKAIQLVGAGRPFYYEAELHRLRGVLLLRSGSTQDEAAKHFESALSIARRQNARSLELRAARELHQLYPDDSTAHDLQQLLYRREGMVNENSSFADNTRHRTV